jgi:hypothetical protein
MYLDCFPLAFCFRTNSKHDESLTRVKKLQTCEKKNSFIFVFHLSLAIQYARNGVNISPAEVYCLINTLYWS